MEPAIYILAEPKNGLFDGLDPEELSAAHPAWADDARRFGPWSKTVIPDKTAPDAVMSAWRSEAAAGNSASLICGRCLSTMDGLRYLIDALDLSPWESLMATEQKQGRGQRERTWISPPGNLYLSWYWPEPGKIQNAAPGWNPMTSLLAGELTAAALESFGAEVRIKWPNDLLVNNKKVCGILVENRGGRLIVGIGLNLAFAPPKQGLRDMYAVPAASLYESGFKITPLEFWLRLAETGRSRFYHLITTIAPEAFVEILNRRLAWKGDNVTIRKSDGEAYTAKIQGLSQDGGLVISRQGNPEIIYTGSILPKDS